MFKFLTLIKKNLIVSIVIAMLSGLVFGYFVDTTWMKNLILPLTFVLVYPMMVTLKFNSLVEKGNVKLQLFTQLLNFIVFPLVAFGLGYLFFREEPYFRLGLLLISLLPTSGMTISWTVMAKGNVSEAIRMVLIGLLMGALLSPFYITFFLGTEINVPIMKIFTQILIVVVLPIILALITQVLLKKKYGEQTFNASIKPKFPLFSTLGVVLMIFTAMSLRAKVIISNPSMILTILIPLILLYFIFFIISVGSARLFFNRQDGIALVNGTLIRSLSLSLVITLNVFEGAGIAALLIALAYVLQVQLAAWNVKLTDKIFKK